MGKTISGLLFVDDLVLIAKAREEIARLIKVCQDMFELKGMEINCSKSNILNNSSLKEDLGLWLSSGRHIGDLEQKQRNKYLGVLVSTGRTSDIFKSQRVNTISRLKSYAGLILAMAKDSFDPIEVGMALWESVALESVLYSVQVISLTKANLSELDSIQASFAADLIGVCRSTSQIGILREMGWEKISIIVARRKLLYWTHLCLLGNANWANKALQECSSALPHGGRWTSSYRQEINDHLLSFNITDILKDNKTPKANIK